LSKPRHGDDLIEIKHTFVIHLYHDNGTTTKAVLAAVARQGLVNYPNYHVYYDGCWLTDGAFGSIITTDIFKIINGLD